MRYAILHRIGGEPAFLVSGWGAWTAEAAGRGWAQLSGTALGLIRPHSLWAAGAL